MGGVGNKQIAKLGCEKYSYTVTYGEHCWRCSTHDKCSKYYIENTWWLAW
jgi:hypothetical protein